MKQWMKYAAVVCSFLIMIGIFFPNSGNKVSASETVSGDDVAAISTEGEGATGDETTTEVTTGSETTTEGATGSETTTEVTTDDGTAESWILTINYNLDGGTWSQESTVTETSVDSGNNFNFYIPEEEPTKDKWKFSGWLCSVSGYSNDSASLNGRECVANSSYTIVGSDYNGATITLTAQWQDDYQDAVKVIYDYGDGTVFKEETITQQLADSVYESTFRITVTSEIPSKDGYTFTGWICNADNTSYAAGSSTGSYEWATYSSGDSSNPKTITFTAQWEEESEGDTEGITINDSGTYSIIAGVKNELGEGSWVVTGDSSTYTGGITFYVGSGGTYTFTKQ